MLRSIQQENNRIDEKSSHHQEKLANIWILRELISSFRFDALFLFLRS